jgi:hypothetical protein
MMEGLQISIPQRMLLLRIVLIISLVVSVLLSLPLWSGSRNFPCAAVVPESLINSSFDFIYILIALICWLSSLILKRDRLLIFIACVFCAVLVVFDLNRLQPWFYVYNCMLLVFVFYNGRVDDPNKYTAYFIILQIMLASVYFFCGLSQLNPLFTETDFLDIVSPLKKLMSERQFTFFNKLGSAIPYLLMFIGLGLIISPIRYLAITFGVCIHFLLIIFLFPSSGNQNYSLWFSNLCFMAMMILLFSGKTKQRYFSPTFLFNLPIFYPVMTVFVILPLFNNSGQWPDYPSFNFKSGNYTSAVISLSPEASEKLPPSLKKYCDPSYTFLVFDYKSWCRDELHVDCYPSALVFNSICGYLRATTNMDVKEIELQMIQKQKLLLKP